MACFSPLKGYRDPCTGGWTSKRQTNSKGAADNMEVACGCCLGCRIDHGKEWTARNLHEQLQHKASCFLTLTYRDPWACTDEQFRKGYFKPQDGSLNKEHVKKFLKRLRKKIHPIKIRYYHCGEYGEKLERPHYHMLLYGFDFPDKIFFNDQNGYDLFVSKLLEDTWKYGFCTIGALTFETAAYTCSYAVKKITGERAHHHYMRFDTEFGGAPYWLYPEYATMSRKPGIGAQFAEKYYRDMRRGTVPLPFDKKKFGKIPRFYDQIHELKDPEGFKELKERRKEFKEEHPEMFDAETLERKYQYHKELYVRRSRNYEKVSV